MNQATLERTVTEADTAAALDPSLPPAASTPFVLAIAEGACHAALQDTIKDGELSVGTKAEIEHTMPSRVGALLSATAELQSDKDGRYSFDVRITDDGREVARVSHTRAIVPAKVIFDLLEAGK